jgi:glycosidase
MASDHPSERAKGAKLTSMFHTSLTGTLFIYQGEEIGLCNVPRDWAEEEYKDIETIQAMDGERDFRWKQNGKKGEAKDVDVSDILQEMRWTARDNGRTPMQVKDFFLLETKLLNCVVGLVRACWFLKGNSMDARPRGLQGGLERR